MRPGQHPAEPCLFFLFLFQLSQVSGMAQMEIYYQIESKENREDKNAQKICRKISGVGSLSDVEGQPTAPQSRGDSLPKQETRPDLDEAVWPVTTHTSSEIRQHSQETRKLLHSFQIPPTVHT